MSNNKTLLMLLALIAAAPATAERKPIDRQALVTRHNPTITAIDKSAPFMVGNGNFAFTADITGLQTFPEQYSSLAPLLIESQWSWHSFPNTGKFTLEGALKPIKVPHRKTVKYPALSNWDEAKAANIQWLRENPHRFSLGRLALHLEGEDGKRATFADLSATKQTLDMWNGKITSSFTWLGKPVEVETSVYPYRDILIVKVKSPLLSDGHVGIDLKFAGVSHNLNPDPSDWAHPDTHHTEQIAECPGGFVVRRDIDATQYFVRVQADKTLRVKKDGQHEYQMFAPGVNEVTMLVIFQPQMITERPPPADKASLEVPSWWQNYWMNGGFVDLTGSKHPRANELQRRIIMSQYLTAVNSAGTVPPQEEGLFSNSWNGKFHLEMHPWHAAHFAIWGRPELLERSMPWYLAHLEEAKARAKANGVKGAWWPKMVGPEGRESPSTVNPFIMWQQPHPIYLAEALYNARKDQYTLDRYKDLVFETANLLASWSFYDKRHNATSSVPR